MISDFEIGDEWIMDSGYTFHMTPNKQFFIELEEFDGGKVVMGNNHQCDIKGIGSVKLKLHDGSFKILSYVRFVPGLKRNLISLGTLDKAGFSYKSENGTITVYKDSLVKLKGVLKDGLYMLLGNSVVQELNNVENDENTKQTQLWHRRLAHISQRGIQNSV